MKLPSNWCRGRRSTCCCLCPGFLTSCSLIFITLLVDTLAIPTASCSIPRCMKGLACMQVLLLASSLRFWMDNIQQFHLAAVIRKALDGPWIIVLSLLNGIFY